MTKSISVSSVQKRLNRDYRRLKKVGGWRAVADLYDVGNVAYVYNLAVKGQVPTNQEVRYKLGLDRRPRPKAAAAPPSAFKLAVLEMAERTRAALHWKPSTKYTKLHEGDQRL